MTFIMTQSELIEGIVASITFPLIGYFLKEQNFTGAYLTMITWFLVWVARKTSVHLYDKLFSDDGEKKEL